MNALRALWWIVTHPIESLFAIFIAFFLLPAVERETERRRRVNQAGGQ